MNVCIIDIGSNTIKASIYKVLGKLRKEEIAYQGSKEKLITYIDENVMSTSGINRLCNSLENLMKFSQEYKCEKTFAFATASLRNVKNAKEITDIAEKRYGVDIEILSEEEEALCSLKGLLCDFAVSGVDKGIMIDMGGGSTELVVFENGKAPKISSMNFGCLSLINPEFGQPDYEENVRKAVMKELNKCSFAKAIKYPVFLIGGTARAIIKILNELNIQNKSALRADGKDFEYIVYEYQNEYFQDLLEKAVPSRKTTILSGAIAYSEIIKFIKPTSIAVSNSGVRDGYLEKILP